MTRRNSDAAATSSQLRAAAALWLSRAQLLRPMSVFRAFSSNAARYAGSPPWSDPIRRSRAPRSGSRSARGFWSKHPRHGRSRVLAPAAMGRNLPEVVPRRRCGQSGFDPNRTGFRAMQYPKLAVAAHWPSGRLRPQLAESGTSALEGVGVESCRPLELRESRAITGPARQPASSIASKSTMVKYNGLPGCWCLEQRKTAGGKT